MVVTHGRWDAGKGGGLLLPRRASWDGLVPASWHRQNHYAAPKPEGRHQSNLGVVVEHDLPR